jgi:hypothetical protein
MTLKYPVLNWFSFFLPDLPEGDPKLQVEKRRYAVGDTLRGNCSSPASSPPTNLTWIVNGKRVSKLKVSVALYLYVSKQNSLNNFHTPYPPTILVSFFIIGKAYYSLILQLQQHTCISWYCMFSLLYQINLVRVNRNECQVCSFCSHSGLKTECVQSMMRVPWAIFITTINLILSIWLLSAHVPLQKELVLNNEDIGGAPALANTAA